MNPSEFERLRNSLFANTSAFVRKESQLPQPPVPSPPPVDSGPMYELLDWAVAAIEANEAQEALDFLDDLRDLIAQHIDGR